MGKFAELTEIQKKRSLEEMTKWKGDKHATRVKKGKPNQTKTSLESKSREGEGLIQEEDWSCRRPRRFNRKSSSPGSF